MELTCPRPCRYDRQLSQQALKMLLSLGFRIVPTSNMVGDPLLLWSFGKPAAKQGGTYVPRPFPTDRVELTGEALELVDKLGRHTHNVRNLLCRGYAVRLPRFRARVLTATRARLPPQGWARKRLTEGWTWGPRVDDRAQRHNCLVPFDFLTGPEKDMERAGVKEAVKIIIGLGFMFVKGPRAANVPDELTSHSVAPSTNPAAIPDRRGRRGSVTLPSLGPGHARTLPVATSPGLTLPSVTPLAARCTAVKGAGAGSGEVGGVTGRNDGALGSRVSDIMGKLVRIERSVELLSQTSAADLAAMSEKVDGLAQNTSREQLLMLQKMDGLQGIMNAELIDTEAARL